MSEFISDTVIKSTRKPHRCAWCFQIIPAKSLTLYVACKHEGDFWAKHFHPECRAASEEEARSEGESYLSDSRARGSRNEDGPPQFRDTYRGTGPLDPHRIEPAPPVRNYSFPISELRSPNSDSSPPPSSISHLPSSDS